MANLKQIKVYLRRWKLPYKIVKLDREAYTVRDVVRLGINSAEIVKTLIVRRGVGKFVALALRGDDRVDFKKIRKIFGSKSELAKLKEVEKTVGVPVGAVCPILIVMPLYIDKKVLGLSNIHMGSGDLKNGLEMKLENLLKVVGKYKCLDFSI